MGVVARVELLQDGVAQDERAVLAGLVADAARLHRLVDDVHRLVDAQEPALLVHRRPVDLGALARATARSHEEACAARSIALRVVVAPVRVDGDRGRLVQVLDNLLSNAVRYTDAGGRIVVRVRRSGPTAVLSVSDSGIGIAPEHLGRVFDRFWRAGAAVARVPEGSGVGLAVVSDIVRAHGGRVEAASPPGGGAAFTVSLPLGSHAQGARGVLRGAPATPAEAGAGSCSAGA